jgi:hypothetical protein
MQKNNDYKVFTPFVLKRLSGAEAIAKSSKAKGGAAMLTYEHYNAKLPIYKAARAKFDVEKAKKEFSSLQSKLSYSMEQTDFQKLMGELEVLGELIIKHEADMKKMASGGFTAGRWYSDNKGGEYRFIGQDSAGNSLFNDGEKTITKSLEDFEDSPKEKKLFKFFEKGGEAKPKKAKAPPKPKEKVKLKMYGE